VSFLAYLHQRVRSDLGRYEVVYASRAGMEQEPVGHDGFAETGDTTTPRLL
jgi:hypothetical protein